MVDVLMWVLRRILLEQFFYKIYLRATLFPLIPVVTEHFINNKTLTKLSHERLVSFLTLSRALLLFVKFEKSNIPKCNRRKLEIWKWGNDASLQWYNLWTWFDKYSKWLKKHTALWAAFRGELHSPLEIFLNNSRMLCVILIKLCQSPPNFLRNILKSKVYFYSSANDSYWMSARICWL